MVLQNSSNQSFSNNSDGYSLGGGVTRRTLSLSGANLSILLNSVSSGNLLQFDGSNWVNIDASTFGTGSVTNIATGTGLTGGPITNTGTIAVAAHGITNALFRQSAANSLVGNTTGSTANVTDIGIGTGLIFSSGSLQLDTSGITAGTYGNGSNYVTVTVDALGRITSVGTVALGNMAFQQSNNVNIMGGTITGMANPVNATDVANKAYVDGVSAGLDAKQAVRAATTADLNATYSASPNFTLTANTNGSLVVDGITLGTNDRVLVKNQAAESQNGIYSVTQTGDVSTPFILTRTVDMDTSSEVPAAFTFVIEGSQAGNGYVVTGFTSSDVLDTNNIVWTQYSQAGAYSAASSGGLSIDTSSVPALFKINFTNILSAGALGSNDLIAISQDGTNVVKTTISSLAAEIAGSSVFGAGAINVSSGTVSLINDSTLTQAGGTLAVKLATAGAIINNSGLDVSIDNATIVNNSGTLAVGTVQTANIADSAVTYAKIQNEGTRTLLGNPGTTAAAPSEIPLSSNLRFAAGTLDLGTSINISGTVGASNVSGTNTGDQTITLTGDVTGSGTGSFATTLATVNLDTGTFTAVTVNGKGLVTSATNLIATGDATGTAVGADIAITLANSGVTAGTYGDNNHPAIITVDSKGRVTAASTGSIALGTGSVTQIVAGAYLTGGTITNTGTIAHATSGVTAGTYSKVVVDAYGHVISGTNNAITWVDVTGTIQTMSANTGYMADNASLVTLTLPVSANFGDIIPIVGFGAGGWTLAQNSGQTIHFGNKDTTIGTAGSISSTNRYDSLELFCAVANTDFVVRNSVGDLDVL